MESVTAALLLTVALAILCWLLFLSKELKKYPPGPSWIPIFGNSAQIKKLCQRFGSMHGALKELARAHKTDVLGLHLGRSYYVVVFGEDMVRQVFSRDEFQARPDNFFIRLRTMGQRRGITMTDGPLWREQRHFLVKHLRELGFGRTFMETLIQHELKTLSSILDEGHNEFAISQYFPKRVLNVLWAIATGSAFEVGDARLTKLLDLMGQRSRAFDMSGGLLSQFPWLRFIAPDRTGYSIIVKLNEELNKIIKETIEDHKRTLEKNVVRDFIDAYLHEMANEQEPSSYFTEDQLLTICLDLFIAGSLTTSSTLDFAILQMVLHPEVQAKVHQEIDLVLKDETPKMSDRERMPYIKAVLMESQRVNNVTPIQGPRRVLTDTKLKGYFIPKGSTVLLHVESVQKDSAKFPSPSDFEPERFLSEKGEFVRDKQFFPFGFGIRKCPGEALAKNFIFIIFAGILQEYKISAVPGSKDYLRPPTAGIILSPKPYSVCIKRREPR